MAGESTRYCPRRWIALLHVGSPQLVPPYSPNSCHLKRSRNCSADWPWVNSMSLFVEDLGSQRVKNENSWRSGGGEGKRLLQLNLLYLIPCPMFHVHYPRVPSDESRQDFKVVPPIPRIGFLRKLISMLVASGKNAHVQSALLQP